MTLSEIYILLNNGDFKSVTNEVKRLNKAYRDGNPEITDPEYDRLIDTIKFVDPTNELFNSGVIETVNSDRKERLKYPMFSLEKETSIQDIHKWLLNKGLPLTTELVITAKYDGISILKDEKNDFAWSRGDGTFGETLHKHYEKINDWATAVSKNKIDIFTIGELLIPKPTFRSRKFYRDNGEPFKNARNMIAGLKNSDTISEDLKFAKHVRYGFANEDYTKNKSEQIDFIYDNFFPTHYKIYRADQLNNEMLNEIFNEWGQEFDIDGLVIDINDKNIRKSLGRERNNNPAYARAYKNPDWSENAETEIIDIEYNISKQGYLKPVGILNPVDLEGVTVSRVTLNNAKFIKDNNLGVGSIVVIKRSGMVIPKVVSIIKATGFVLPSIEGSEIFWNENEVELCVKDTEEQKIKKIIFFFEAFNIASFAEKTIRRFYDSGYNTVGKILSMSSSDIQKIEGMGNLSASKLLSEFNEKIKKAPFEIIGHASGCFENIGSRKLKMIIDGIKEKSDIIMSPGKSTNFQDFANREHFDSFRKAIEKMDLVLIENMLQFNEVRNQIIANLNTINGMSDKTSESFLDGLLDFGKFMSNLDIQISDEPKVKKETTSSDSNMNKVNLNGREFVFTGFRDAELKNFIESCGGLVKDAITKKTTDLLTKEYDSNSSKSKKAKEVGARVTQVDDFRNSLK